MSAAHTPGPRKMLASQMCNHALQIERAKNAELVAALREIFDHDAGHPSAGTAVDMRTIARAALAKVKS